METGEGYPFGSPPGDLNADIPDEGEVVSVKKSNVPKVMQGKLGLEPEQLDSDDHFGEYA